MVIYCDRIWDHLPSTFHRKSQEKNLGTFSSLDFIDQSCPLGKNQLLVIIQNKLQTETSNRPIYCCNLDWIYSRDK